MVGLGFGTYSSFAMGIVVRLGFRFYSKFKFRFMHTVWSLQRPVSN